MPVFSNPVIPATTSPINNNSLPDKCMCVDGVCRDPSHKHYAEQQKKQQEQLRQQQLLQKRKRRLSLTTEISSVRLLPTTTCSLYSGSKFRGEQRSGRSSYDVSVHIQVRLWDTYSIRDMSHWGWDFANHPGNLDVEKKIK